MISNKATSVDVAKLAGVSQATVSRAFSPNSKIKASTKEKVMKAAKELNYTPNAIARSLISNSTNIVAVIMLHATNPFYAKAITKLSTEFRKYGKHVLYFCLDKPENLDNLIIEVLKYRVDGIVIASACLSTDIANYCSNLNVPVVLFNRYSRFSNVVSVCCDNVQAGRDCADYLYMKGYRKFAFIGGSDDASTSHNRKYSFINHLSKKGIKTVHAFDSNFTYEDGKNTFSKLVNSLDELPDAVFCASDLICMGAMDEARYTFNLKIPEDIAFMGFDDIEISNNDAYRITTFHQPMDKMVQKICEIISNNKDNINHGLITFPCTLVTRESS